MDDARDIIARVKAASLSPAGADDPLADVIGHVNADRIIAELLYAGIKLVREAAPVDRRC